uniref:response regulator FixJ n=1 Tax=Tanticharoenia sakaeratensis TaxID=444053 RepID=UPI001F517B5C
MIDDDEAVRESLAFLLLAAGHTARTYPSADAFLGVLDDTDRGCVVTDVRMPGTDGLVLVDRLRNRSATLPVIVITGHADIPLAVRAIKAGAWNFIEKPFEDGMILNAVDAALQQEKLARAENATVGVIRDRISALTVRERQVLAGLLEGQANKVIARDLGISPRTIEIHRANLMMKMHASSLSDLVRMALLAND